MPLFFIQKPKCVFAHIPKTGGHSIRNLFFEGDAGKHVAEMEALVAKVAGKRPKRKPRKRR